MRNGKLAQDSLVAHSATGAGKSISEPEVSPIFASAVFRFSGLEQVDEVWTGNGKGYVYSRMANPSVEAVEEMVDALEGSIGTIACSSGMAATAMLLEAALKPGERIVSAAVLYGSTRTMMAAERERRDIGAEFVDISDLGAVERALDTGVRLLFCECISNPLMEVADVPKLAELAHRAGALLAVDNTFATPMLLKPLELGADVVLHSCTKYMNGHDDVMAGTVSVGRGCKDAEKLLGAVRSAKTLFGPVLSPFEAWLLLRGMRTLGVRMQRHCVNAAALADALRMSDKVIKVCYPGIDGKVAGSAAERLLLKGFGGMLSFELAGGRRAADAFISALGMASFVPSLGSYATTVSHPASTSHRGLTEEERRASGISDGLIRVSAGIEDKDDIIRDFLVALDRAGA